jgi:hypothetical protein
LTDLRTAPDVPGGVIFSIKKRTSCPACSGFFLVKGRLGFFIVSYLIDIFFGCAHYQRSVHLLMYHVS